MTSILRASLLSVALVLSLSAHAEKADRAIPMTVEADQLRYDDAKQITVFTGKVVVTKGSIIVRGARVEVRQDAEGNQQGVVTAEPGQRAFFRQKREGVDEHIEGEADVIEYDGKADRVKFIRRAEMRRLRAGVVSDQLTGSVITYENGTDVFSVDGGNAAGGSPAGSGGRVRAVLAPRSPVAATPPTAPARLRPSSTAGGAAK